MAMSKEAITSFGGLKVRNTKQININLLCELCRLLQIHPMQLLCCGARLCRWCSKKGVSNREPFICPFCQTKQATKQAHADRGAELELNTIEIQCYACSWNGSYKKYLDHLQEKHADLECPDCHARFPVINLYEEHREEICENRSIRCELPGCQELVKPSQMRAHFLQSIHQNLLIQFIVQNFNRKNPSTIRPHADMRRRQEIQAVDEGITTIVPAVDILKEDAERLAREFVQIKRNCDNNITQFNETRTIFNKVNETCVHCVQSQNETEKQLENTNKLYLSMSLLLLDDAGSIILRFCIDSDGIKSSFSLHSPTFKTSTFGYLFTLRVCSTPKSTNHKQDYLSIYITLLRTNFDPILVYPFPYNVTLSLCDQSGQGKDIKSIIKADSNPPAFPRPSSERNNEVGVIEFCPLSYLTDTRSIYFRDNVFFIRILFDFMNTGPRPIT